ncbi:unnamed protein product [Moneuplotes crassus]|uniref:Uncharacterized protein n=1 Tax=Euplotes crassus TaxID=5936 RepID=A0AAD1UAC3_EUPCR|nr:unnamed protein product [Moneuplotes crassus]
MGGEMELLSVGWLRFWDCRMGCRECRLCRKKLWDKVREFSKNLGVESVLSEFKSAQISNGSHFLKFIEMKTIDYP